MKGQRESDNFLEIINLFHWNANCMLLDPSEGMYL
jgi:hypothetical protein